MDVQGQHAAPRQGPRTARQADAELPAGCKRILISTTSTKPSPTPDRGDHRRHRSRDADGIVTADGTEHAVDVISSPPASMSPTGSPTSTSRVPRGEDLVDRWNREAGGAPRHRGRRRAEPVLSSRAQHRAGTQLGGVHDRVADPLRGARDRRRRQGQAQALAPTRAAQDAVQRQAAARSGRTVWNTGGCRSWYLDEHGVNRSLWSGWLASTGWRPGSSSRRSTQFSGSAAVAA